MEQAVKYRLTGAIILVALMVIFLPLLFDGSGYEEWRPDSEDRRAAKPPIVFEQYFPNLEHKSANPKAPPEPGAFRQRQQAAEPAAAAVSKDKPDEAAATPRQWIVQAGVFSDQGNAGMLAAELRDNQFENVRIKTVELDGRRAHAVRLGPFDQAKAQRVTTRLKQKLNIEANVKIEQ